MSILYLRLPFALLLTKLQLKGESRMWNTVKMLSAVRGKPLLVSACLLWVLVLGACGVEQLNVGSTTQSSTTCVSDPIVAGSDDDFVPRCTHYYTIDQAQSDIVYRGSLLAGYTIYGTNYLLSCFEYTDGYECNLQIRSLEITLLCDYNDDGNVVCVVISPR